MALVLVLASCTSGAPPEGISEAPATRPPTDAWLGRWTGPEGTYLDIAGRDGIYEITIMNLDGARTFPGRTDEGRIEFERDGVREILSVTDGDGTGMKWLAGKANCLTVHPGEGYCRD